MDVGREKWEKRCEARGGRKKRGVRLLFTIPNYKTNYQKLFTKNSSSGIRRTATFNCVKSIIKTMLAKLSQKISSGKQ
jgi:hypothetical protein